MAERVLTTSPAPRKIAVLGRLGIYPMAKLSLPGRRVLAYLALCDHQPGRGIVAADLWPDVADDQARANLRRALWHVPRGWIVSTSDELRLEAQCDLPSARSAAMRALSGGVLSLDDIETLSRDILPGWYDEWVVGRQDAFRFLRVQALEVACITMAGMNELALAAHAGAAALTAEPLRESTAAALIEVHIAQRNRFAAAQCYRALAGRLRAELGVGPDPALTARMSSIGVDAF